MNASGPSPYAPTMVNDCTRASTCDGTSTCVTVVSIAPPNAVAVPAMSAPPLTAASGRCRASASGGSGNPSVVRVATRNGRAGRRPIASSPPRIAPPP
jgi:hypothetical protein